MNCLFRKYACTCPYKIIEKQSEVIKRSRVISSFLINQIKLVETALRDSNFKELTHLCEKYYDGYSLQGEGLFDNHVMQSSSKNKCPYKDKKEDCTEMLRIVNDKARYQKRRIAQLTRYYNELISIISKLIKVMKKSNMAPINTYLSYTKNCGKSSVLCFDMTKVHPAKSQKFEMYAIYYDEYKKESVSERIECHLDYDTHSLRDTFLERKDEKINLVEMSFSPNIDEVIARTLSDNIYTLIKKINMMYGKRYGRLSGTYTNIFDLQYDEQTKLIQTLHKYKLLGKMNEIGIYEDRYLLLYTYENRI